jgi:hypothetical protein
MMEDWRPATVDEGNETVESDLKGCDAEQLAAFNKYPVTPSPAAQCDTERWRGVVVVGRNVDEVIYYARAEDGFNVSPLTEILEHWYLSPNYGGGSWKDANS